MREKEKERRDEGWNLEAKSGEVALTTERSLETRESGQFAPGGHDNQTITNHPDPRTLDDIAPPGRQ